MSKFQELQEAVKGHLEGSPVFNGAATSIAINTRKAGDIRSKIAEQLGKIGLSIFVLPVMPTRANRGLPGPFYPEVEIQVLSYESPITNRTDLTAYDLADEVERRLHRWNPDVLNTGTIFIDEVPRVDDSTDQLFIFRSVFRVQISKS